MKTKQKLSQEQMAFFETFGFLYFPGLLSDCIDKIIYEFEQIWVKHGGGHHGREHDGKAGLQLCLLLTKVNTSAPS